MDYLKIWILPLTLVTLFAQCTDEGENNTALALAALSLAAPNCTVNGTQFYADGVVDCSSGTSAVGTGTVFLAAAQSHSDVLSLQLTVDVGSTTSDRVVVHGHGSGRNATSSAFLRIDGDTNSDAGGASNSGGSSTGVTQNGDGTYCIEFHGESEVHTIYDKNACTTKSTSAAHWDSEGTSGNGSTVTTGAPAGKNWGITLVNSAVSAITVNAEEQFTD
ncbi:MAG TPA: hypothetical protein DEA96_16505 [Leptospiraceae bacterium]|nr:hypothetical protein [Spirochaetaceae bacterium]HBS06572.1 hypothetical protein [Leptospiraceae bacterium]|tara:strand:- start:141058 stop:141714 length:657 start_codon:yes stop_codon:yes gene_type:complete